MRHAYAVTFTADVEREPVWASDSKSVVFSSSAGPLDNDVDLFRAATDGSGSIERLTQTQSSGLPQALSRDGHLVLIKRAGGAVTLDALLLGPRGLSQQSSLTTEGWRATSGSKGFGFGCGLRACLGPGLRSGRHGHWVNDVFLSRRRRESDVDAENL